jgi:2-hydroxy-6-oxonona-2,4-dienedioate hydrolase
MSEHLMPVGDDQIFWRSSLSHLASTDTAVVFIHGLIVSGLCMLPTAELLAQHYPVLVPDLPGYGRSSKPRECKTIPQLAALMVVWLKNIGIKHTTLVANSFGCHVAAEIAVQAPELIEGLVLIGPPDGSERRLLVQLGRLVCDVLYEHPSLLPIVAKDLCLVQPQRAAQTFCHMTDHSLHEALTQSQVPTLLVHGEKDPVAPARWMQETAKVVRHAKLHTLPKAGHSTNFSNANETAALIMAFIDELNAPQDLAA